LLVQVNTSIQEGEDEQATEAYIRLAEISFEIAPFIPKKTPEN